MIQQGSGSEKARKVRVPGRSEIGTVIQEGKNLGGPSNSIYCVVVYFKETGEVAYYEKTRVTTVD